MNIIVYPACFLALVLCAWTLEVLRRRSASERGIIGTGAVWGVAAFILQCVPPPGYMLWDFKTAYWPAGDAALYDHAALAQLLTKGVLGFVNLPVVAYLFSIFAIVNAKTAGFIFIVLGIAGLVLAWRELKRTIKMTPAQSGFMLFLALASGPMFYSAIIGNTSQWVLILLILGVGAFLRGEDWKAGVFFALAALIKPPLLLFGVYALFRGRWRTAVSGAVICLSAVALSMLIFGWQMHVLWLKQTIGPALSGLILAYNVQSIGGAVGRLFVGSSAIGYWEQTSLTDQVAMFAHFLQFACAAAIVCALVTLIRKRTPHSTLGMEVSLIIMAVLLLPNLTWSHYYAWALIPLAFALRSVFPLVPGKIGRESFALLFATAFIALPVQHLDLRVEWMNEIFARLFVSLPLIGGVILTAVMVRRALVWTPDISQWGLSLSAKDGSLAARTTWL